MFALTLVGAHNIARSQFPDGLLNFWFANDGELFGKRDSVSTALKALIQPLLDIGLVLNQSKCAVWVHTEAAVYLIKGVLSRTIKTSPEGLIVLGYQVAGNTEALKSFSDKAI